MRNMLLSVFLFTLLAKGVGFLRDVVLATYFGLSDVSDAYLLSTSVPLILFTIIAAAVNANLIPFYTKIKVSNGVSAANVFTSRLLNVMGLFLIFAIVLITMSSQSVVKLFAPGFSFHTTQLASGFLTITSVSVLFTLIFNVMKNILQVYDRPNYQTVATIPMNIVVIVGIVVGYSTSNYFYMVYAFVIGSILQVLVLKSGLVSAGFSYHFQFRTDKNIIAFGALSLPIVFQSLFMQANQVVDNNIASRLLVGGVSAIIYAKQLENLVYSSLIVVVLIIAFPRLSKYYYEEDYRRFDVMAWDAITLTLTCTIPACFALFYFTEPIISLLFERGNFGFEEVVITASVLKYSAVGLLFLAINQFLLKLFYIRESVRLTVGIQLAGLIVNIFLTIGFYNLTQLGLSGVSIATSVSYFVVSMLLLIFYHSRYGIKLESERFKFILIIFACSLLMIFGCEAFIEIQADELHPGALVLAGVVLYGAFIFLAGRQYLIKMLSNFQK